MPSRAGKSPAESEATMLYIEWNRDKTDYTVWDDDRIRNAFNFGNGTHDDFKRYMRDNRKVVFEAATLNKLDRLAETEAHV